MPEWLQYVSLTASSIAVTIAVLTFLQRERTDRITFRKQLTDTIERLTELNTEIAKYQTLSKTEQAKLPIRYVSLLNDQRRFNARYGAQLIETIPDLVSAFELLIIARAFGETDAIPDADRMYRRAIDLARQDPEGLEYCFTARRYATFLFWQGQLEPARKMFRLSHEAVSGTADRHIAARADTLEPWAELERDWGNSDEALALFVDAQTTYGHMLNPVLRRREVTRLNSRVRYYDRSSLHWNPS